MDDLVGDDSFEGEAPTVCESCHERCDREGPTPLGWQFLVFTCERCGKDFCEHLEAGGNVCLGCFSEQTTKRVDLRHARTDWPVVPPADDGTAQETEPKRDEEFVGGGTSSNVWVILLVIFLLVGLMGYVALVIHHAPPRPKAEPSLEGR